MNKRTMITAIQLHPLQPGEPRTEVLDQAAYHLAMAGWRPPVARTVRFLNDNLVEEEMHIPAWEPPTDHFAQPGTSFTPKAFKLQPCGQPRYRILKRHHHWLIIRRTGSNQAVLACDLNTLHEAHKLIEGDLAAHRAHGCTPTGGTQ